MTKPKRCAPEPKPKIGRPKLADRGKTLTALKGGGLKSFVVSPSEGEVMDKRRETELRSELDALNAEVTAVLAKRKAWMDAHMAEYAKVQVGEEIYDLETGRCLGTVSKLYRYWDGHNPLYDTSMNVHYQFHTGRNIFDNTSRRYVMIGTKSDADREHEWRNRPRDPNDAWEQTFGKNP